MPRVLDPPVTENTPRKKCHIKGQAAEVVSKICMLLAALHERVNDSSDRGQSRPQTAIRKILWHLKLNSDA